MSANVRNIVAPLIVVLAGLAVIIAVQSRQIAHVLGVTQTALLVGLGVVYLLMLVALIAVSRRRSRGGAA